MGRIPVPWYPFLSILRGLYLNRLGTSHKGLVRFFKEANTQLHKAESEGWIQYWERKVGGIGQEEGRIEWESGKRLWGRGCLSDFNWQVGQNLSTIPLNITAILHLGLTLWISLGLSQRLAFMQQLAWSGKSCFRTGDVRSYWICMASYRDPVSKAATPCLWRSRPALWLGALRPKLRNMSTRFVLSRPLLKKTEAWALALEAGKGLKMITRLWSSKMGRAAGMALTEALGYAPPLWGKEAKTWN